MNNLKIKNKIFIDHFKNSGYFNKVKIVFNDSFFVIVNKVKNSNDFKNYVVGLETFNNEGFLVYPSYNFSTRNFKLNIDLIILDINFKIINFYSDVEPNTVFSFNLEKYSILILKKGFIKQYKINKDMNIKLAINY